MGAAQGGIDVGQGLAQGTSQGQQALGGSTFGLFGLAQQSDPRMQQGLMGLAGQGSTDQLIGQVGTDIGQQLNEQILPGLRSQEVGVGALGGARGELVQGQAIQGAQDAFAGTAAGIRQSDLGRRQGAFESAGALQQQELSRRASALGQAGQQASEFSRLQGLGSELEQESAASLMDLGLAPSRAAWGPMQNYANILNGSPSIGTFGTGSSKSKSTQFSGGF